MNIYPSLISAPLLHLQGTIQLLEPWCAGFHLDIMDFHFVPNLTWGPGFIQAIRNATSKQLWIHLMVEKPFNYLKNFKLNAQDIVSIHYESCTHDEAVKIFEYLHTQGLQASLAIKPTTPIKQTLGLFPFIDQFLLMSVEPGFSGQDFLNATYERLQELYTLQQQHRASFRIALDGGITQEIFNKLAPHHVEDSALAHALFGKGKDPVEVLKKLHNKHY
jgi:ribulose-phosphate 3-epimerase